MMTRRFDPDALFDRRVCLDEVSKDLDGELYLIESQIQVCDQRDCRTLKTFHGLRLHVASHEPCDSELARQLDGTLVVRQLVTAFANGSGERRGTHKGRFRWHGDGLLAEGYLSGLTNAGTHREPIFEPCQPCHARGFMEGCFHGHVVEAEHRALRGCRLRGTYRLRFDPSDEGGEGGIEGTLEGVVVCPCGDTAGCTEFQDMTVGSRPNPWTVDGHTYRVYDHTGTLLPNAEIVTRGGHSGLDCGFRTQIALASPASTVEATLVHTALPATVEARSGSAVVASGTMTGPGPESIVLTAASGIDNVVVDAPQDETVLLSFCTR